MTLPAQTPTAHTALTWAPVLQASLATLTTRVVMSDLDVAEEGC